jgi:hypothetical protein
MKIKETKLKLQEMAAADNAIAGMLLNLIKNCSTEMQRALLGQLSDSFAMVEQFEERMKSPEFRAEIERRVRNGR